MLYIYGNPLSSPTNKVRYVANFLNLDHEFKTINLGKGEHHTQEFLQINPYGKVPAIVDNGFNLSESNAIIRYLADKAPSNLYPQDIKQRAITDQWLDYAVQHIAIPFSKIMFNSYFYKLKGTSPDQRSLEEGHEFLANNLPLVEKQLSKQENLAGNNITLADIAMLAATDTHELSQVDLTKYPHLANWRKKLMQQAFYTKCHDSYTKTFNSIMAQFQ